jgi:protein AroM
MSERAHGNRPMLGLVTIGQTPRPDFEALFGACAPGVPVDVRGALDGLTDDQVAALEVADAYPLLVRLRSGSTAEVPLATLVPLVEWRGRELAAAGASLVVVLCAGAFPDIACGAPVLLPGRLLPAVVASLGARRVGIVTPVAGQVAAAHAKWVADGFEPVVRAASPVHHADIVTTAADLAAHELDLVVLDCMGHDERYRTAFAERCGHPVLAAQTLVARVAGSLLASGGLDCRP